MMRTRILVCGSMPESSVCDRIQYSARPNEPNMNDTTEEITEKKGYDAGIEPGRVNNSF